MFMASQQEAAAIQKAFHEGGEWAAVVELRRVFRIDDNACALDEAHLQAEDNASGQRPSAYHPLALEFAGDELERVPWHVSVAAPDLVASGGGAGVSDEPMMSAPAPLPASRLRDLIADALHSVKSYQLPGACERLGLAPGTEDDAFRSKRVYVLTRLERLPPASLVAVAQQVLSEYGANFDLQEAVDTMAETVGRRVSELTRRNIGRALNRFDLGGHVPLLDLIRDHFPIDVMRSQTSALDTVADDLDRYTVRNSDWENDQVLGAVGAYACSQRRFFAFIEAVAHPRTRDERQQRALVDALNPVLERDGFALMPTGQVSGYSVFTVKERASAHQTPADTAISAALAAFDEASVHDAWRKALERRASHPEGAITSARTLLETVCKHIIEDAGGTYTESDELPKLYRTAATHLNLAPDQHTEEVFKTILGNCQSIVNSLGSVRNKLSDAHGRGRKAARPLPRHAELAVNLAGTMATFLVSTWRARQASTKP